MGLLRDLKQPFNLVMLVLAIGALVVAVYAYYYPRTDKRISYLVTPAARIFDSKSATPKIRLLDASNMPVTTDTYVNTVTLWNSGSQPIEPAEVRKPLRILVTADRLLDYTISKEKDRSISHFTISPARSPPNGAQAVDVQWTHFDPKHGLTLAVIYSTANANPKLWIETEVAGLESLRDARALATRYSWLTNVIITAAALIGPVVAGIFGRLPQFRSLFARILSRLAVVAVIAAVGWLLIRTVFVSDTPTF
jgi:hypothetical protein